MNNIYREKLDILCDKVEGLDDRSWEDLCIDLDINLHPDSLRKSFAVGEFSGYKVYQYFTRLIEDGLTDTELDKLEDLKKEITKEKIKYQDARREYNNQLRAEARYENLVDILKDKLCDIDLSEYKMGEKVNKNLAPKFAILQLSDWHVGALVDTPWNIYNVDIAKERATELCNKVKSKALNYNITDLMIEINGDMIEGMINVSNRVQSEEDAVAQIVIVSKILINFINELRPYFKSIKVATTLGNHGRLVPDKKAAVAKENMEMLIPEFLRLGIDKDIPILTSHGFDFMQYAFADRKICLSHGQYDKINNVIQDFSKVYKVVPDEIHLGHTHSYKDINESNIYVTVNGSLKGSDEYALTLRETTKPSQNLIVYDGEDRAIFEILLK